MSKKHNLKISGLFLKHSLGFLGEAIQKQKSLPIVENILFEYDDNTVHLTTTDLEITIRLKLNCITENKGKCLIDYVMLHDIVHASAMGDINIEILEKTIKISEDDGTVFSFASVDANDYVNPKKLSDKHDVCTFVGNPFADNYKALSAMISKGGETESAFHYFNIDPESKSIICSNKSILGFVRVELEGELKKPLFIPNRLAKLLSRIKLKEEKNLVLKNDGNTFYFEHGNVQITCISPTFKMPNFMNIVPKKSECVKFQIKKTDLMAAIRKCMIIDKAGRFDLKKAYDKEFGTMEPLLTVEVIEKGEKLKVPLVMDVEEKQRSFTVNLSYVEQAINLIDDEDITFYYQPSKMGLIRIQSENKLQIMTLIAVLGSDERDKEEIEEWNKENKPKESQKTE